LEHRFEPFSQGRGFITQERVDEIETIAARHGIYLAPLYNADGPLENGLDARWNGREYEPIAESSFCDRLGGLSVGSAGTVDPAM